MHVCHFMDFHKGNYTVEQSNHISYFLEQFDLTDLLNYYVCGIHCPLPITAPTGSKATSMQNNFNKGYSFYLPSKTMIPVFAGQCNHPLRVKNERRRVLKQRLETGHKHILAADPPPVFTPRTQQKA